MRNLLAAGLLLLMLSTCATAVREMRIPTAVLQAGGLYQPWTLEHTAQRADVLACVGLADTSPLPSLWVSPRILTQRGRLLMAFYDRGAHAVVFAPYVTRDQYWAVFRHEMIHTAELRPGHSELFLRAAECDFWPSL